MRITKVKLVRGYGDECSKFENKINNEISKILDYVYDQVPNEPHTKTILVLDDIKIEDIQITNSHTSDSALIGMIRYSYNKQELLNYKNNEFT